MSELVPDLIVSKKELVIITKTLDIQSPAEIEEEDYIKVFGEKTLKSLLVQAMHETNHFDMSKRIIKSNIDARQIAGHVLENFLVGITSRKLLN